MSYQHIAISKLYPNVAIVTEDEFGNLDIRDAEGNEVSVDEVAVAEKTAEITAERKLYWLRVERDKLLKETDYMGLSDRTMTEAQSVYRQALRDITNTYSSLDDVIWPEKP